MIKHYLKCYMLHKGTAFFYGLTIVLITALQLGIIVLDTQSNDFIIQVLDYDNTTQSSTYINDLNAYDLIKFDTVKSADKTRLLEGSADALLIIPKDYFNQSKVKLQLYYTKTNVKVPAIIDILAAPLLQNQLTTILNAATNQYKYPHNLADDYQVIQENLANSINVDVKVIGNRKNTLTEYALEKKEHKIQTINLSYFMLTVLLIFPAASANTTQSAINDRLSTLPANKLRILGAMIAADALYYILPVLIIAISAYVQFDMPFKTLFILTIIGLIITLLLHMIFKLIFMRLEASLSALIIIPSIIFFSLLGGAFFDSSLLTDALCLIGRYSPLGLVATTYDALYSINTLTKVHIATSISYSIILSLLIFILYRLIFRPRISDSSIRR